MNKQQQESPEIGHQYSKLLLCVYIYIYVCMYKMSHHPTAQNMCHAKIQGHMIHKLEEKPHRQQKLHVKGTRH